MAASVPPRAHTRVATSRMGHRWGSSTGCCSYGPHWPAAFTGWRPQHGIARLPAATPRVSSWGRSGVAMGAGVVISTSLGRVGGSVPGRPLLQSGATPRLGCGGVLILGAGLRGGERALSCLVSSAVVGPRKTSDPPELAGHRRFQAWCQRSSWGQTRHGTFTALLKRRDAVHGGVALH
ncbi:hypothetical protein GWK47_009658 [Chionoecetes opilio]|uniref:Uncharacterized protein n=1 Tax=Chionoecetes opilio TaxID=41210 RepID=A0A8J4Y2Y0_CHIOP|nr:hypothetical protein GWK47_009658 [Chionoecetes opilio]